MMRRILLGTLVAALACSPLVFGANATTTVISGDYVEARTASVFAGACHYNGELGTTGRDALLAWNIASGHWKGTDLSGVRALAVVSSDANLIEPNADRRSEVIIDDGATNAQAAALVDMLRSRFSGSLGRLVDVSRGPVSFRHDGATYRVESPGLAVLSVKAMPNDLCCRMPNMVWYSPLVPLSHRKVGYTLKAYFAGGPVGGMWERASENSAFYGHFAL
jgi:hypothetical protein